MPLNTLKKYFYYSQFRPGQLEIIQSILNHQDTIAILPTGGGKSICFQIPALMLKGTTIVISPLISLMKDQVDALVQKKITATYLNSSLSQNEIKERLTNLKNNFYQLIYLAPERLKNKEFVQICQLITIPLIVVDEAHCISMWGQKFRPSYQSITNFINQLPHRPIKTAFTATATKLVIQDIIHFLQLKQVTIFKNSFKRDNLMIDINIYHRQTDKNLKLLQILHHHQAQSGIIYVMTRHQAEEIVQLIKLYQYAFSKISLAYYHGGMKTEERNIIQEKFLNNQLNLIVATNAFGMGVDKANIRYVIHYQLPGNIENYYQEIGRAGRDQQASTCYLLFHADDIQIPIQLIKKSYQQYQSKNCQIEINKLKAMIKIVLGSKCYHQQILKYFDDNVDQSNSLTKSNCQQCSICLAEKSPLKNQISNHQQKIFLIRQHLAAKKNVPQKQILTNQQIQYISILKPKTTNDYLQIPGIGRGWIRDYYQFFNYIFKDNY